MPDPYATRAPDLSWRPTGPPPWLDAVRERGGGAVAGGDFDAEASFLAIGCRGIGTLAPFARVDPGLGTLLAIEHAAEGELADAGTANRLFTRLRDFAGPLYAIKHGSVGGPPDRPGCFTIPPGLIASVLAAALAGEVEWEVDPDFGYEVPASVPGIGSEAARALLPRLLYGENDRVYEHASLVATKKRERAALASALSGLDPAVAAASGWPPTPSPSDWRD